MTRKQIKKVSKSVLNLTLLLNDTILQEWENKRVVDRLSMYCEVK